VTEVTEVTRETRATRETRRVMEKFIRLSRNSLLKKINSFDGIVYQIYEKFITDINRLKLTLYFSNVSKKLCDQLTRYFRIRGFFTGVDKEFGRYTFYIALGEKFMKIPLMQLQGETYQESGWYLILKYSSFSSFDKNVISLIEEYL
jgi:hypothetical protein